MVNERISDWIKEGMKKGYSESKLEEMLIKKGFSKDEIEKGLENPANKTLIIIIAAVILVIIIFVVYYFAIKTPLTSSIPPEQKTFVQDCMSAYPNNAGAEGICRDIFYFQLAIEENNTEYCNNIKAPDKQALCLIKT
jgi:hypothetical protein